MASNNLKAYVRYDGSGKLIAGSLILARFKPAVGNYKEISATECCDYIPSPLPSNCIEFVVNTTDGVDFGMNIRSVVQDFTYTVTWGDGTTGEGSSGEGFAELLHDFPDPDTTYTVRICFDNALIINELEFYGND